MVGDPGATAGETRTKRSKSFSLQDALVRRTKPPPEEKPMSEKLASGSTAMKSARLSSRLTHIIRYPPCARLSVDHKAFEQRDFSATGDHVYATVRLVQTIHATGKTLEQPEVIHHFTFRNGKVVRCRVSEDTALTKAAFAK
jgi:hypothetical protein